MPERKKGVVPRLRFPEFRDAGPWEVRTVEEIAEKIAQGGTPDTTVPEYWNGDIPWITPAEMGDDALCHYTEKTIRTISERGLKNSSAELLPAHSVIISSRAPIGYVTINKVPMATNQGCKAIVPKQEIYHEFLYFSLLKAKRQLNDLGAGAGFKEISASTLKNFKITLPNRFEQQKIADCLLSLDELITLQAQKLDALNAHKKGLMQQLFPREGETTPRLRFPEFRDAGPWEVKRLGDKRIAKFVRERVSPERIPLGHYVSTVNLLPDFAGLSPAPEPPPPNSAVAYRKGDILMSNIRPYLKKIWIADRSGGASNDVLVVRPGENTVGGFLGQILMSDRFVAHVMDGAKGVKMPRGDLKQIQDFEVPLPQKAEQQKIADCLSSLDELIELQAQKLDALKAHKKGLLQQLFPQEVA
jgi:type I restriction enzyme S subunit